jgi:hypothetical protein
MIEERTDKCPNSKGLCTLVSNGKGSFACKICGVGYFVSSEGKLVSFDWHGTYPSFEDPNKHLR